MNRISLLSKRGKMQDNTLLDILAGAKYEHKQDILADCISKHRRESRWDFLEVLLL
jgi:hypothetical protein